MLVARWSMPSAYVSSLAQLQQPCTKFWPGFDDCDIDGGLQHSDTESSLFSSFLLNTDVYGSSNTISQKKPLGQGLSKLAATCWIRHCGSAIVWRISASTRPLELALGSSSYLTPSNLTSRHLGSRLAFVVVFAYPSGPKTHTALSAARSWTSGTTTPWRAFVAVNGSLVTMQFGTSSFQSLVVEPTWQLLWKTGLSILRDPSTLTRVTPLCPPVAQPTSGFTRAPSTARKKHWIFPSAALFLERAHRTARTYHMPHTHFFSSCAPGSRCLRYSVECSLCVFQKVVPSHPCFTAPCLTHSFLTFLCILSLHLNVVRPLPAVTPVDESTHCHSARRVVFWPTG